MTAKVKIGEYLYSCQPRWGFGLPPHGRLASLIGANKSSYIQRLEKFSGLPGLAAIPLTAPDDSPEPRWLNPWFCGLDGLALYGMLTSLNPRLMLEIGSGNSTKFARRAIADHQLRTRLVSVDPQPRAEVDSLCDEVLRSPAEAIDIKTFSRLKSGDVLFIDSSHRSFQNSDVTMLFLDILPELEPGVIVHIHDIYLPFDYPPSSEGLLYNEQYLLAALMLGGGNWLEPLFPSFLISQDQALFSKVLPLWQSLKITGFPAPENSFWLRIKKRKQA